MRILVVALAISGWLTVLAADQRVVRADDPAPAQVRVSTPPEIAETGQDVALSGDGRFVVFAGLGDSNAQALLEWRLYLYDHETGETTIVSTEAMGEVLSATDSFAISADGNTIAYIADNMRRGDPTWTPTPPGFKHLIVFYDRRGGTKHTFDVDSQYQVGELVDGGDLLFLRAFGSGEMHAFFNRSTEEFVTVEIPSLLCDEFESENCPVELMATSEDARFIAYTESLNCSLNPEDCGGEEFVSRAYVLDRQTGDVFATEPEAALIEARDISDDGRTLLVRKQRWISGGLGTCQVYAIDTHSGLETVVDVLPDGTVVEWPACASATGRLSRDGRFVTVVVPPETGASPSVFLRNLETATSRLVSLTSQDEALDIGEGSGSAVSDDGTVVAFVNRASNLIDADSDALLDAFVTDFTPELPPAPEYRMVLPFVARD